jgi:hypothetical protein
MPAIWHFSVNGSGEPGEQETMKDAGTIKNHLLKSEATA